MIVQKSQVVGDFLDGHGGLTQKVHGELQPKREIIVIGGNLIFLLKYLICPGAGEMGVGGDLMDAQSMVQVLLDKTLHGEGGRAFFQVENHGIRE